MSRLAALRPHRTLSLLSVVLAWALIGAAPAGAAIGYLDHFGGSGSTPGLFDAPEDVAIAPDGSIYVADTGNSRVQKFDAEGDFLSSGGSLGSGTGNLNSPRGLVYDGTVGGWGLVAADTGNDRLMSIGVSGLPLGCISGCPPLSDPSKIDYRADIGWFVVANTSKQQIVLTNGPEERTYGSLATEEFGNPEGVAVGPDGDIYVADTSYGRIQRLTGNHVKIDHVDTFGAGELEFPHDVEVVGETVYVADTFNDRIAIFNDDGVPIGSFGTEGSDTNQFSQPAGIEADCHGNLYVADTGNDRILKLGEPGNAKPPCTGADPDPPPDPPTSGGGSDPGAGAGSARLSDTTAPALRILGTRLPVRGGTATARLRCPASERSGPCRGRLTLRTVAKLPRGRGRLRVLIASSAFRVAAGKTKAVRLKLGAPKLRLLRTKPVARRVRAIAAVRDGAGNRGRVSKRMLLRLG